MLPGFCIEGKMVNKFQVCSHKTNLFDHIPCVFFIQRNSLHTGLLGK